VAPFLRFAYSLEKMTDYSKWDSKATKLVSEAEEEEAREKVENDRALGLEGGPKGPPTAKAESEMKELGDHSEKRKEFIQWSKGREVAITHESQSEPIELSDAEFENKAVRLVGCKDVTYIVPEQNKLVKLFLDKCVNVKVKVLGTLITSCMEACRCSEVDLQLAVPLGTMQVDECSKPLRVLFSERDHVCEFYHQNSPGLSVGWEVDKFHNVGNTEDAQFHTRLAAESAMEPLITNPVRRGEGEFPTTFKTSSEATGACTKKDAKDLEPEPSVQAPVSDELKQQANAKREAGNNMFRANDFMQAAMEYTESVRLDPTVAAVWGNRSQCWLKLGDHDKALADAIKCTEIDASNAKGWFRRGMSLHAMQRYQEALPALLEAEKLDPKNKQIPEAIKFAQLMCRRQAGGA